MKSIWRIFCSTQRRLQPDGAIRRWNLTRREMDLIQYFYRSRDRIVSKRELLENVWQYTDSDVETRTVDIHILKLRKKLDTLSEGREFIVTIRGEGWRLSPEV
jgi:DNA-binding response OmpR family regulator